MKNHLGSYECKLCLTLHNNEVHASTSPLSPAGHTCGLYTDEMTSVDFGPVTQSRGLPQCWSGLVEFYFFSAVLGKQPLS